MSVGIAKCQSCGVPWVDHLGMVGTCERLQQVETALGIILAVSVVKAVPPAEILERITELAREGLK